MMMRCPLRHPIILALTRILFVLAGSNTEAQTINATTTTTTSDIIRQRPHVLMIVMDDLGSHDLGIHGTQIQTPYCDSLAMSGVYLDDYYVFPHCSATRAALLSGKYSFHTGVFNVIQQTSTVGLPLEDETLANLFKRGGYATHAVGKWHVGHSSWEQTPTFRGFDSFLGFYIGGQDYFQHVDSGGYDFRFDRQPYCGLDCSEIIDERGNYSTHVFTHHAIQVIQNHHANMTTTNPKNDSNDVNEDTPLFLYLAYQAVHCPSEVPFEYKQLYDHQTKWSDMRKTYAGMLTAADEGIGNVTRALQELGMWENTLVVFTTDNGGPTITGCIQGSSNQPKRGGKCSVWQGGTTGDGFLSGPALAYYNISSNTIPQKTDTNTDETSSSSTMNRFPHLFHVVDWFPTLAEMIGILPQHVNDLDGKSQLKSLQNPQDAEKVTRQELFVGYSMVRATRQWYGPAIRFLQWKLIQGQSGGPYKGHGNPPGSTIPLPSGSLTNTSDYLLFDVSVDPMETTNVATKYPSFVQRLIQRLQYYQPTFVPPQKNFDSNCPWTGFVNTSVGPTWMPWCTGAQEVIVYG